MVIPSVPMETPNKHKPSAIVLDDDLTARLQGRFEIVTETDQLETSENDLYDAFMSSQEPHLQEQILDRMFAACHNGQRMPEKERKRRRLTPNCRSCKHSFSACLRAIGGVMRKIDKTNYWLNIRRKKRSGFKKKTRSHILLESIHTP